MAAKKSVFDNPVLSTKVKSANVKLVPEALLGYLVGPFCGLLANSLFGTYLVSYFRDTLFKTEIAAGNTGVEAFLTVFPMISAILIVLGNLLAGQIIERTKTKAGKARPYILLSAVVLAVISVVMFIQPLPDNTIFKMVWLVIAYNLFYAVAFPLYNTANSALIPVSTRNGKQRGLLASLANMAVLGGAGAGSIIFPQIIGALAASDSLGMDGLPASDGTIPRVPTANGYLIIFIVIGIVTFIGCLAQYYFTRERVTEESMVKTYESDKAKAVAEEEALEAKKAKGPSLKEQARAIFKDKFFMVTIIFYLLYQFSGSIKNAAMKSFTDAIYASADIGASGAMSILGIVGAVPMAVAIVFVAPLCNKFGKRPIVFIGMVIGVIGGVIAGIWYQNFIVAAIGIALKCLGSAPAGYMILAMIADCLDHMEAKNGFRCDGFGMSLYSAILIAAVPLATGIVSGLASIGSYGTVVAYIWIETGAYALCAITVLFFGVEKFLPEDNKKIIARQKAEAEAAGIEWIEPAERLRIEEEEADRIAEEARVAELKARCEKKGLSFEEEEGKYQAKLAEKKAKAEAKAAAKAAKSGAPAATEEKPDDGSDAEQK